MDAAITFCGKYLILISVFITAWVLYSLDKSSRRKFIYQLTLGGIIAITAARIASHFYFNPRPFISDGVKALFESSTNNGFPSDHALLASFLGFSVLVFSRKLGVLLLTVALLVAWGRVAGGVHHGVDVAASFLISGLSVLLAKFALGRYFQNHHMEENKKKK